MPDFVKSETVPGTAADPWAYLGSDVLVVAQDLVPAASGDANVCHGLACLVQDLVHRLGTPRGDLPLHPEYGFDIARFLHLDTSPVHVLDFEQSVQEEVENDPRVQPGTASVSVLSSDRDCIRFRVQFQPVGATNPLNLVLGYDLRTVTLEVVRGG